MVLSVNCARFFSVFYRSSKILPIHLFQSLKYLTGFTFDKALKKALFFVVQLNLKTGAKFIQQLAQECHVFDYLVHFIRQTWNCLLQLIDFLLGFKYFGRIYKLRRVNGLFGLFLGKNGLRFLYLFFVNIEYFWNAFKFHCVHELLLRNGHTVFWISRRYFWVTWLSFTLHGTPEECFGSFSQISHLLVTLILSLVILIISRAWGLETIF